MIRILSNQVPRFWEVIKFCALNSDQVSPDHYGSYCMNLLLDLLSGKKQCYIVKDDNKISTVLIASFYFDRFLSSTVMQLSNVYSFEKKVSGFWRQGEEWIRKLAENNDAKVVIIETGNKAAISLLSNASVEPYGGPVTKFTYFL